MTILAQLLFVSAAVAHAGVKQLLIDGTSYPPFDSRIDHLLSPVKRIEWSHDVVTTTFNPITNYASPDLACRENSRAPLLKAPARAGSEIFLQWTPITRMHQGPIIAYMGYLPTPDTPPQQVKFFKIWEKGFDTTANKWANEVAADNGNSFKVQIPSDIKAGTFILRVELIALHGNMKNLNSTNLAGVQFYPHCFNIDVIGTGTADPEGVVFPGAYKPTDPSFRFQPFMTYGNDTSAGDAQNSKFVTPGPPKYAGKYDAPTGPMPTITETGAYSPELNMKYEDMIHKIEQPGIKLAVYVNTAWAHYKPDAAAFKKYPGMVKESGKETDAIVKSLVADLEAFKKATA